MKQTYQSKRIEVKDPEGVLIIDDERFPLAIGAIGLTRGITDREIELYATTMSYKLHSYNLPISGASGGINSARTEDFDEFIAKPQIKSLLEGKADTRFLAGPDMSILREGYSKSLEEAGISEQIKTGLLTARSEKYDMYLDNLLTAYGAVTACEELLKTTVNKGVDPLEGKSFVLEGYGRIGTGIAKLLEGRADIRAISNRFGCVIADDPTEDIVDSTGFDIDKLLELYDEYDDDFIYHTGLDVYPVERLFDVACDILIPGLGAETISAEVAKKIIKSRPNYIVPVSDFPYTNDGQEILAQANISAFPDFITSAGSMIGSLVYFANNGDEDKAIDLVDAAVRKNTIDLIAGIEACGDDTKTMYQLAVEEANKSRESLVEQASSATSIKSIADDFCNTYLN